MAKTEHAAGLSAIGTLPPADIVGSSLTLAAGIVAHEALLLSTLWADHGLSLITRESHFLAMESQICHAFRAVRRAHAAAVGVIPLGTLFVPMNAPLFAVLALLCSAIPATKGFRLLAKSTVASETFRTVAPTVFNHAFIAFLTNWVAQVVGLLVALAALADHLADVSESRLQPARLLLIDHLLWNFGRIQGGSCLWLGHWLLRHLVHDGHWLLLDWYLMRLNFFNCLMRSLWVCGRNSFHESCLLSRFLFEAGQGCVNGVLVLLIRMEKGQLLHGCVLLVRRHEVAGRLLLLRLIDKLVFLLHRVQVLML